MFTSERRWLTSRSQVRDISTRTVRGSSRGNPDPSPQPPIGSDRVGAAHTMSAAEGPLNRNEATLKAGRRTQDAQPSGEDQRPTGVCLGPV